jgi:small subunit ribosomal protein S9
VSEEETNDDAANEEAVNEETPEVEVDVTLEVTEEVQDDGSVEVEAVQTESVSEDGEVVEETVIVEEAVVEEDGEVVEEETFVAETSAVSDEEATSEGASEIPGADLEPISVEPVAELSIEERARLEAEEIERAEAESENGEEDEDVPPPPPAPAKIAKDARFIATGKRKRSVARVIVLAGDGSIKVNDREIEEYFPRARHRTIVNSPLVATGYDSNLEIRIRVHGGGISGQAGAVRHGIARALTEVDPELRGELKRRGFLTRDARAKERRKAGFKKARKKPQFSKR